MSHNAWFTSVMDTLTPAQPVLFQTGITVDGAPVTDQLQAAHIADLLGACSVEPIDAGVWMLGFDGEVGRIVAARIEDGDDVTFGFTAMGHRFEIEIPAP